MAFDFKKECRAPRLGKSGGFSSARNASLQTGAACVSWAAGMKFSPWNAGPRVLKPLFINRDKLMTSGIVWGRRMHRLFCARSLLEKQGSR